METQLVVVQSGAPVNTADLIHEQADLINRMSSLLMKQNSVIHPVIAEKPAEPVEPVKEVQTIIRTDILVIREPNMYACAVWYATTWVICEYFIFSVLRLTGYIGAVELLRWIFLLYLVITWIRVYTKTRNVVQDIVEARGYEVHWCLEGGIQGSINLLGPPKAKPQ
jgi:hypothetical protein